MPDADRPATPDRCPVVPGYVLEERLGRGGSGEVWRARPRRGGPAVAVKVLHRGDPEQQVREAEVLAGLEHPHLVALHEVVRRRTRDGEQVALVLDLLAGGSLADLLARRGRLRPGEVVTAVAPVAAALAHLHDRGIVHGDLSPGNVVLTAEGRPMLTDLGVARAVGEPGSGQVTPPYVDPVVARGGAPGPASDVFGVAAAAFHALTGIPPWNAAGPGQTVVVAASGELPDLALLAPEAPGELVAVVQRGLSPHPHLRGTAAAFALDLRHACRPERIALPAPGVDRAALARTGYVPRTELTHQVRRPPGAHAAPAPSRGRSGWPGRVAARLPVRGGGPARAVRRVLVVTAVLAALAGSGWLGVQWGRGVGDGTVPAARTGTATASGSGSATAPSPSAPPGTVSSGPSTATSGPPGVDVDSTEPPAGAAGWAQLVGQLYGRRAAALSAGDPGALSGVYPSGSALLDADAAWARELAAAGQQLQGFAPLVVAVQDVVPLPGGVRVRLVDRVPPYVLGSATGGQDVPGRGDRPVVLTLLATTAGWRIDAAELTG
ncbi:serine/threonine-protein kinase [Klenkia brasiliensis]|uniref:serine/threonine-protein kinase n=1 Tax=Klenkia brasiliensis TaxID=333142 RepID=UPI0024181B08|nr:serine/threonine-protein kinase [Klenkia brasiliensis]